MSSKFLLKSRFLKKAIQLIVIKSRKLPQNPLRLIALITNKLTLNPQINNQNFHQRGHTQISKYVSKSDLMTSKNAVVNSINLPRQQQHREGDNSQENVKENKQKFISMKSFLAQQKQHQHTEIRYKLWFCEFRIRGWQMRDVNETWPIYQVDRLLSYLN